MAPTIEEPKGTLTSGDPEASYVSPDLSTQDGTGTLPENEQDWHDLRDGDYEAEVEAAIDSEDKVVKRRLAEAEAPTEAPPKTTASKTATPSTT